MNSHRIKVSKTARYYTLGSLHKEIKEVWFVIHGFAQLADTYLNNFEPLDNGERFIIAPEALNKFYLRAGKPEVGATWMTREDREAEIADYTAYLDTLYDAFSLHDYHVRITALGFSQGVATVSRWIYQNPRKIHTLIFYAGEPGNELQNQEGVKAFDKTKNYFIWGTRDQYVNELNIQKYKDMLTNFEFVSFDGKHEISVEILAHLER